MRGKDDAGSAWICHSCWQVLVLQHIACASASRQIAWNGEPQLLGSMLALLPLWLHFM